MIGTTLLQRALGRPSSAPLAVLSFAALANACTCEDIPEQQTAAVQEPVVRMENPKVPPLANGCLPQPAGATPATLKLPEGGTVRVSAYAHDLTDKSGVSWNQSYPSPCLDDKPPRKGYPNAAWHGNYTVEGDQLCLTIDALYPHYPPKNRLQIGYTVQLVGMTFDDGTTKKNIVLYEFSRLPGEVSAKKCVTVKHKEPAAAASGSAAGAAASAAPASTGGTTNAKGAPAAGAAGGSLGKPSASSKPAGSAGVTPKPPKAPSTP